VAAGLQECPNRDNSRNQAVEEDQDVPDLRRGEVANGGDVQGDELTNPDGNTHQRQEDDGRPQQAQLGVAKQDAHDNGEGEVDQRRCGDCAAAHKDSLTDFNLVDKG